MNESAHRVKQICGRVLRFAVAMGLIQRDVTADLKGALTVPVSANYAAITAPKPAAELMRTIYAYYGPAYATAALELSALLFVRPGELRAAEWREIDLDDAVADTGHENESETRSPRSTFLPIRRNLTGT